MPEPSLLNLLRRRPRFKIGTLMILVVIAAVAAWGYTLKRWRDAAVLEYAQATDRLHWSEQMHKKGYVSKAQFLSDQLQFEKTKHQLGY